MHDQTEQIGSYRVDDAGGRLVVADAGGLCVWLGLREPRVSIEMIGPSEVAEVRVEQRARRAADFKRPQRARRWQVAVLDRAGAAIGRRLHFRSEAQARAMAARIGRYAPGVGR